MAHPRKGVEVLQSLGLSAGDLEHLARRGFVSTEVVLRDGQRVAWHFKLRWRDGRQQKVICLGRNAEVAKQVAAAVAFLQQPRRLAWETSALLRSASRQLRHAKQHLARAAADAGLHFHGRALRRRRTFAKSAGRENGDPSPVPSDRSDSIGLVLRTSIKKRSGHYERDEGVAGHADQGRFDPGGHSGRERGLEAGGLCNFGSGRPGLFLAE